MSYSVENITSFLKTQLGISEVINSDCDIFEDLGVVGDDFHDMMNAYSKKFSIKMDGYLWYFHCDEEGGKQSIGGAFFSPPYSRVSRIKVTPRMLTDFANEGKWGVVYPDHKMPKIRYDLLINFILIGLIIAAAAFYYLNK